MSLLKQKVKGEFDALRLLMPSNKRTFVPFLDFNSSAGWWVQNERLMLRQCNSSYLARPAEVNGEKMKNQELRQGAQSSKRDYDKLRIQLDQARRKAIGTSGSGINDNSIFVESSQNSASAPQPFYSGVSRCLAGVNYTLCV